MDIEAIKEKYPLAVDALKGNTYKGVPDCVINTADNDNYCFKPTFLLPHGKVIDFITQRQLSKMLADILNQLTKP